MLDNLGICIGVPIGLALLGGLIWWLWDRTEQPVFDFIEHQRVKIVASSGEYLAPAPLSSVNKSVRSTILDAARRSVVQRPDPARQAGQPSKYSSTTATKYQTKPLKSIPRDLSPPVLQEASIRELAQSDSSRTKYATPQNPPTAALRPRTSHTLSTPSVISYQELPRVVRCLQLTNPSQEEQVQENALLHNAYTHATRLQQSRKSEELLRVHFGRRNLVNPIVLKETVTKTLYHKQSDIGIKRLESPSNQERDQMAVSAVKAYRKDITRDLETTIEIKEETNEVSVGEEHKIDEIQDDGDDDIKLDPSQYGPHTSRTTYGSMPFDEGGGRAEDADMDPVHLLLPLHSPLVLDAQHSLPFSLRAGYTVGAEKGFKT
jgi:hypothetical protein